MDHLTAAPPWQPALALAGAANHAGPAQAGPKSIFRSRPPPVSIVAKPMCSRAPHLLHRPQLRRIARDGIRSYL
jgi:hypothetical protein